MTTTPKPTMTTTPRARRNRRILLVVLGVIAAVVIALVVTSGGSGGSYTATIVGVSPADPGEARVGISVQNTGSAAGTPTCTISLSSPGGAYTGYDGVTPLQPIPAHGSGMYHDTITVTNNGAQYVTVAASSVSCS